MLRYVDTLKYRSTSNNPNPPKTTPTARIISKPVTKDLTYLDTAKNITNEQSIPKSQTDHTNDFQTLLKEINELNSICNLKQLINIIRDLKVQFQKVTSPLERILVVQNIAQKYGF